MFSYLWAGKFDDYFSIVRKIDDSEIQNIDIDLAFGYGYYITGDYRRATERLKQGKNNPNDRIDRTSLFWLQHLAISRADRNAFTKFSDEALMLYNKELNNLSYISTLILRAGTMLMVFDDFLSGERILEEIENIFKDPSQNVSFDKLGVFAKWSLISAYGAANNRVRQKELYNQSFNVLSENNSLNALELLKNENYKEAISVYNNILKGTSSRGVITSNYNIGLAYMGEKNYTKALTHFNLLKKINYGQNRSFYYAKSFLHSGLCNLELKNYRLAKSNIETFLQIWEPAPESIREKKVAKEALEKINKAIL